MLLEDSVLLGDPVSLGNRVLPGDPVSLRYPVFAC